MRDLRSEPEAAFAPLPASSRHTRVRLGSWFQQRPEAIRAIATLAIIVGVGYFTFRAIFTSVGVPLGLFLPLFIAELFGFVAFLTLAIEAWRVDPTPRRPPLDTSIDVVITTYDEDIDIVEPTVLGALLMRGNTTIYLSDDGNRPEMYELAQKHGLLYQSRRSRIAAKAGNINAILPRLTGELLLVLDADHVAAPDFLDATTGYFRTPSIALVQTAHSFRNHNSVMHDEEGRHEQSLFFDVLLPGRNRLGSAFWCGSAALIRLQALRAVGGMATRTITEDFETSLELQRRGWAIVYHNEHLVQALAPDNIESFLLQRFRWARGTLAAFRPGIGLPWSNGLDWKKKISYIGALMYYLTPLQRLAYAGSFIAASAMGLIPMNYLGPIHLWIWGIWIVTSLLAVTALERGTSQPFEGTRNAMLSMGVFLRAIPALLITKTFPFDVTPKNQTDQGGVGALRPVLLPVAIAAVFLVILFTRWAEFFLGSLWPFAPLPVLAIQALLVLTVFGLLDIAIVWGFSKALVLRRQERVLWRFPVHLTAEFANQPAICVDLHQSGAGFHAPRESAEIGEVIAVGLRTRQLNGKEFLARGHIEVRSKRVISSNLNLARFGGVVQWDSPRSRQAVIEHCYVIEPYFARNQQWMRQSPRVRLELPGRFNGLDARIADISIGGAAVVVFGSPPPAESRHLLTVLLPGGAEIRAPFLVKNVTELDSGGWRLGGQVDWPETGWLSTYLDLSFGRIPAERPLFVASPLM